MREQNIYFSQSEAWEDQDQSARTSVSGEHPFIDSPMAIFQL